MPFKVRCPYCECQGFMLLEDDVRGAEARCLLCRRPIFIDSSGNVRVDRSKPPPVPTLPADGTPQASLPSPPPTLTCPDCKRPLRLPAYEQGRPIQCPACKRIFVT